MSSGSIADDPNLIILSADDRGEDVLNHTRFDPFYILIFLLLVTSMTMVAVFAYCCPNVFAVKSSTSRPIQRRNAIIPQFNFDSDSDCTAEV